MNPRTRRLRRQRRRQRRREWSAFLYFWNSFRDQMRRFYEVTYPDPR